MIWKNRFDLNNFIRSLFFLLILSGFACAVHAQTVKSEDIRRLITEFKKDERGPYQAIRWFCPDGTMLPPKERCSEPGGIQHALAKDIVKRLAAEQKIYLGQILAGTDFEDFFDAENQNLRIHQYQVERYLKAADDGWIMRRARYYRGAVQVEDEENWGEGFLKWILARDELITTQFFLLRQIIRDIPHHVHEDRWQNIRGISKTISDSIPSFMDIRVKLHNEPGIEDIKWIQDYYRKNQSKIVSGMLILFQNLISDLQFVYRNTDIPLLEEHLNTIPRNTVIYEHLNILIEKYHNSLQPNSEDIYGLQNLISGMSDMLLLIREKILLQEKPELRLSFMDLSTDLERILFQKAADWHPQTIGELLNKNYLLVQALTGCGYLELWEWQSIEPLIEPDRFEHTIAFEQFAEYADYSRRVIEWSTGMVRAVYIPVVNLFSSFEPLAQGFTDDRIRSSLLLELGQVAGRLSELVSATSGIKHSVLGLEDISQIRGINPGFAVGELVVKKGDTQDISFSANKIYLVQRAPMDMKPVAGIATVAEGNLVSHVQLLARNLGIPNAVFSEQNLSDLLPFSGMRVFYAVSPGGSVVLKLESEMTAAEKLLIEQKQRNDERIYVPTKRLNLADKNLLSLQDVRASDSGRLCGPKAANLGQLKSLFPGRVVDGIVIPFGIFRAHLDQSMPGTDTSYWLFLQNTFNEAAKLRNASASEAEIENWILKRFTTLQETIKKIPFIPGFKENLADLFVQNFSVEIGQIPVFIRSDTNMEDLKDFTGAGLNLTVFNVLENEKIYQAIRDVWASPYAERSYRWRQKYMLNPENVFPSILIIPTVRVDKSGVLITTGIVSADPEDLTIAFNRGAGGAVEGQIAESYLLRKNGRIRLLSPSRERAMTLLPETGGTVKKFVHFNRRILSSENLQQIRIFAVDLQKKLKDNSGIGTSGPYDVELGFANNMLWLFQVRPYVENKKARSSQYLQSLDTFTQIKKRILLQQKI